MPGIAAALVCAVLLIGCTTSPSPSNSPASPGGSTSPTTSPSSGSPLPTAVSTGAPPPAEAASLPVRRSARDGTGAIHIASGPGGTVFVAIGGSAGTVLARLDAAGQPLLRVRVRLPARGNLTTFARGHQTR